MYGDADTLEHTSQRYQANAILLFYGQILAVITGTIHQLPVISVNNMQGLPASITGIINPSVIG
jgi:hypothetical protein